MTEAIYQLARHPIFSVSIESCSTNDDFPSILLMDDVIVMEDVHYFSNPILVATEKVDHSYYSSTSVMWSMAGQQVVKIAHAGGSAEDYCRVTIEQEDCLIPLT